MRTYIQMQATCIYMNIHIRTYVYVHIVHIHTYTCWQHEVRHATNCVVRTRKNVWTTSISSQHKKCTPIVAHTHIGHMQCGTPQSLLSGHTQICVPPQFHPNIRNARL